MPLNSGKLHIDEIRPDHKKAVHIDEHTVTFSFYNERGVRVQDPDTNPPTDRVVTFTELLAYATGQGILL